MPGATATGATGGRDTEASAGDTPTASKTHRPASLPNTAAEVPAVGGAAVDVVEGEEEVAGAHPSGASASTVDELGTALRNVTNRPNTGGHGTERQGATALLVSALLLETAPRMCRRTAPTTQHVATARRNDTVSC